MTPWHGKGYGKLLHTMPLGECKHPGMTTRLYHTVILTWADMEKVTVQTNIENYKYPFFVAETVRGSIALLLRASKHAAASQYDICPSGKPQLFALFGSVRVSS